LTWSGKTALWLLTTSILLSFPRAAAKPMDNDIGYIFIGLTEAYRLGSLRFGHDDFEFGIFPGGLGAGLVYRESRTPFYGVIAPVLGIYPGSTPAGINASGGAELGLFRGADIRFELSSSWFSNGLFAPYVILGLTFIK